jgi:hypothetical protein
LYVFISFSLGTRTGIEGFIYIMNVPS